METITAQQHEAITYLSNALRSASIEYQVSGGLAAIAHGATRPLYDIDLEIYRRDVEAVRSLFADYITEDWNNELEGEDDLFDIWIMKLEVCGIPVDVNQVEECRFRVLGGPWISQPEILEYETMEVVGHVLPVQSKKSLITYKSLIARDTDLEDIRQMLEAERSL